MAGAPQKAPRQRLRWRRPRTNADRLLTLALSIAVIAGGLITKWGSGVGFYLLLAILAIGVVVAMLAAFSRSKPAGGDSSTPPPAQRPHRRWPTRKQVEEAVNKARTR